VATRRRITGGREPTIDLEEGIEFCHPLDNLAAHLLPSQVRDHTANPVIAKKLERLDTFSLHWAYSTIVSGTLFQTHSHTTNPTTLMETTHKITKLTQLLKTIEAVITSQSSVDIRLGNHMRLQWTATITMCYELHGIAVTVRYTQKVLDIFIQQLRLGKVISLAYDDSLVRVAQQDVAAPTIANSLPAHAQSYKNNYRSPHGANNPPRLEPGVCRNNHYGHPCARTPCPFPTHLKPIMPRTSSNVKPHTK
jgi:hypothetical protein